MNLKNKIINHYKTYFDLHAKGIPLEEDDYLNIDWAAHFIEKHMEEYVDIKAKELLEWNTNVRIVKKRFEDQEKKSATILSDTVNAFLQHIEELKKEQLNKEQRTKNNEL